MSKIILASYLSLIAGAEAVWANGSLAHLIKETTREASASLAGKP